MAVHKFPKALIALSICAPLSAHALGIGQIHVNSALNQPLRAEIPLDLSSGESVSDIVVRLASQQDFAKFGIQRPSFLSGLRFEAVSRRGGGHVIRVSSSGPIREPFVTFLVEVVSREGRALREFTVLLDPPGTRFAAPSPRRSVEPRPRLTARAEPVVPRPARSATRFTGEEYGPVQSNETLWAIAQRVRPSGVTVKQMMVALYKANPQAFFGDINQLKTGVTLSVPQADTARGLSPRQASAEFGRLAFGGVPVEPEAVAPTPTAPTEPAPPAGEGKQLELVAGQAAAGKELRQESKADVALEVAESLSQENQSLRERIAALESQLSQLQQRMAPAGEVEGIVGTTEEVPPVAQTAPPLVPAVPVAPPLGGAGAEGPAPMEEPPTAGPAPTADARPEAPLATPEQIPPMAAGEGVPQVPVAPPVEPPPPAPPVVAAPETAAANPPAEAPTPWRTIGWVGGLIAVVGLGFAWIRTRRSREGSDFELSDTVPYKVAPRTTEGGIGGDGQAIEPITTGYSSMPLRFVDQEERAGDEVLNEVEVYLAYNRHKQAEYLLRQAIGAHPNRDDYKLRLLEVLAAQEDRDGFEGYVEDLLAEGKESDAPFWKSVVALGRDLCPDNPIFNPELLDELRTETFSVAQGRVTRAVAEQEQGSTKESSSPDFSGNASAIETRESALAASAASLGTAANLPHIVEFERNGESATAHEPGDTEPPKDRSFAGEFAQWQTQAEEKEPAAPGSVALEFPGLFEPDPGSSKEFAELEKFDRDLTAPGGPKPDLDFDTGYGAASEVMDEETFKFTTLTEMDQVETKLDLAQAYMDMNDQESAQDLLQEVLDVGNPRQQQRARALLASLKAGLA